MTNAFADYTYIAGSSMARGSVWQGPDHLLVVEGRGWWLPVSEMYRRVDYANIQSLTIVRTQHYLWLALAWGVGALFYAFIAFFAASVSSPDPMVLASLAFPVLLLVGGLALHLVRGPTCACALQTNVQVLRIRALNRMRIAKPAMDRLAQLCRQHQGALPQDELAASAWTAPVQTPVDSVAGVKTPWTGSIWTAISGVVLLLWGLAFMAELFVPGMLFVTLDAVLGSAALVLTIVSLARTLRMQVPGPLLAALWGGLVMELVAGVALFVLAVAATAREAVMGSEQLDPGSSFDFDHQVVALAKFSYEDAGVWAWAIIGIGAVLALLGLATLAFGGVSKKAAASAAPSPPPTTPPPAPPGNSAS